MSFRTLAGMTTKRRLWLGFGTLIAVQLGTLLGIGVWLHRLQADYIATTGHAHDDAHLFVTVYFFLLLTPLLTIGIGAGIGRVIARTERQLQQSTTELSELNRRKNEFLALLAHELRNPLAPISNAVQILRLNGSNSKAQNSTINMMERQIAHMIRLVDDLLDVSRISRGMIELRKENITLASVVNHAIETAEPHCDAKGLALEVRQPEAPLVLDGDPVRLAQMLGNLLHNACKFTDKGGRVRLLMARDGNEAVIRVQDSGHGIAADKLEHIFDLFFQSDASLERVHGGLGIGLALVKSLTELHGGSVQAHSAGVGHGSEFIVRLPLRTESAPPVQAVAPVHNPVTANASRRILVVDDNRASAKSLTQMLKLAGHDVHTAYDGLEAVEAATAIRPGVILLDIGLPKLNGYEVARRIREQPGGDKLTLIALTGWAQDTDKQRARESGFDHHLVKPLRHADLNALLAQLP